MINLIGPGGAGKTTAGRALASHIDRAFIDLDLQFINAFGDISQFLETHGYAAYSMSNINVYLEVCADENNRSSVLALSSGFMTYARTIHPAYHEIHDEICRSETTFVLLPSLDLETCVRETVLRQGSRPFSRSNDKEEAVIRDRFPKYAAIPATKIQTSRPVEEIVVDIAAILSSKGSVDA